METNINQQLLNQLTPGTSNPEEIEWKVFYGERAPTSKGLAVDYTTLKRSKGDVSTQNCDVALHRELRRELSNVVVNALDGQQGIEKKEEMKALGKLGFRLNRKNRGYHSTLEAWLCPFDLLPSCLGILRGSKYKNLLEGKYGIGKTSREGSFILE